MSGAVREAFERVFAGGTLGSLLAECDTYELADEIRSLAARGPILEAGSGSGRWVAWMGRQGGHAVGLDWSADLCARARASYGALDMVSGDLRNLPFAGATFGGILALGSIEHVEEGPSRILAEFGRVLMPGGDLLLTVPYGGVLRRTFRALWGPFRHAAAFARTGCSGMRQRANLMRRLCRPWAPRLVHGPAGWAFYEYEFTAAQMHAFVKSAGFDIVSIQPAFHDEGLLHTFRRLAGTWDSAATRVRLSGFGRMLKRLLPIEWAGHMLCIRARKPGAGTGAA